MTTHLFDLCHYDSGDQQTDTDFVAGDCYLSNTAIREATGKVPLHPIQVLAQAHGLVED
jgi:hypothetical protein